MFACVRNETKNRTVAIDLWMIIKISQLVSWFFKPSQPQRIISGLRETLIKRYIVDRTNKAELRSEEQSEKAELSGECME